MGKAPKEQPQVSPVEEAMSHIEPIKQALALGKTAFVQVAQDSYKTLSYEYGKDEIL